MDTYSQIIQDSDISIHFADLAGRSLPISLLYGLADLITAVLLTRKNSKLIRAIACNQAVVRGEYRPEKIYQAAKETLRANARCLVDYYHFREHPQKVLERVRFDPQFEDLFQICQRKTQKTLILIVHMGNFDLAGEMLALRGLDFQILSYPHPGRGYQNQNNFRKKYGLNVTPISIQNLRLAENRLAENGTILTGIDRPDPSSVLSPRFFGKPAALSGAFIRLAMRMELAVYLVTCETLASGETLLKSSPRLPILYGDQADNALVLENLERILTYGENWIKQHPEQWSMTYPVWPSLLNEFPLNVR